MNTSVVAPDINLKDRYYVYRGVVLHQKTSAAQADQLYWQLKGGGVLLRPINRVVRKFLRAAAASG